MYILYIVTYRVCERNVFDDTFCFKNYTSAKLCEKMLTADLWQFFKNLLSKELNKTNYITVAIMFLQLAKNCSIIAF